MITNPYETSYGKLIKLDNLQQKLTEYLINYDIKNLNYEYMQPSHVKLLLITGFNSSELALPPFNYPYVFEHKSNKIVAIDLRKYVNNTSTQPLDTINIVKDIPNYNFNILNCLITADLEDNLFNIYKSYGVSICSSFSLYITSIIDGMVKLDPAEFFNVSIATAYYMSLNMISPDNIKEDQNYYKAYAHTMVNKLKYSIPVTKNMIDDTLATSNVDSIVYTGTIDNLIEYIHNGLSNGRGQSPKCSLITKHSLVNAVSNTWYGHGGGETAIIALEHLPTWMSLVYTGESSPMYRKSKLATIISKYSNKIKLDEYIKSMNILLKEKKI